MRWFGAAGVLCLLAAHCAGPIALAQARGSADGALFSLFELHRRQGRTAEARAALARLDARLAPAAPARADVADDYERLGEPAAALAVWERFERAGGAIDDASRMRMARLHEASGQPLKALEIWHALWETVRIPAQRGLVEDRLLSGAIALGRAQALAVELEARLAAGAGRRHDASLLIDLYIRASARQSALEAIQEYLTVPEDAAQLKAQARAYRLLQAHDEFERASRRLMALDPDHRLDYLRGIVLDRLQRDGPQSAEELDRLLAQLRAADPGGVDGIFEGSVLALAGKHEQAIAAYRRAVARDAASRDGYLLLADLLKQRHREDEALALLQRLAESSAVSDEIFIAAMDGMAGTVAVEDELPDEQGQQKLRWAQRLICERLVEGMDRPYLYRLLENMAEESGAGAFSLGALESSLPLGSVTRSATLRELMGKVRPAERTAIGITIHQPDPQRHAAYGRRLLALREELPPDVYLDLGREFLQLGRPREAERVFDLAGGGRRDRIDAKTAPLFEQAGYAQLAIEHYERARIADRDDVGVLARLGNLRELSGHYARANELYAEGLGVLARQAGPGGAAAPRSQKYREYFPALRQGYLMTRRHDSPADQILAHLTTASGGAVKAPEAAQKARESREARRMAQMSGDSRQMFAAARAWAATGAYRDAVSWAEGRLEEGDYRNLCRYVANLVRHDPSSVARLFDDAWGATARLLLRLEAVTGEPALSAAALLHEMRERVRVGGTQLAAEPLSYAASHLSAADLVEYMRERTTRKDPDIAWELLTMWRELLKKPLTPALAQQALDTMRTALGNNAKADQHREEVLAGLAAPGTASANAGLARALDEFWRAHSRLPAALSAAGPQATAPAQPDEPVSIAVAPPPAGYSRTVAIEQAIALGKWDEVRGLLRAVWKQSVPFHTAPEVTYNYLLRLPLFDTVVRQPFAVEELEDYLRAVDEDDLDGAYPLFDRLAQAYRFQGTDAQRFQALSSRILANTADSRDFNLWLAIAALRAAERPAGVLELLEGRLRRSGVLSQTQWLSIARIYAGYGRMDLAADAYRRLAAAALAVDDIAWEPQFRGVLTAFDFVDEIRRHLDAGHFAGMTQSLLNLTRPDAGFGRRAWRDYQYFAQQLCGCTIPVPPPAGSGPAGEPIEAVLSAQTYERMLGVVVSWQEPQ